jgi:hypothetical protein
VTATEHDDDLWEGTEVLPAAAMLASFDATRLSGLHAWDVQRDLLVRALWQRDAARFDLLQKWELYQACNGYDFLGEISKRLDAMNLQLNAAARHRRGEPADPKSQLPHSTMITVWLLGVRLRFLIPLDYDDQPVSYEQAMANLVGATATACTHAVASARWAVNEHQRAERMTALLREVLAHEDGKEHTYDKLDADLLERIRAELP